MSRHSTSASARARRMATAPMSMPVTPGKRPNGCNPTPMMATSMSVLSPVRPPQPSAGGPERERHDLVPVVVRAEGHHDELHLHPDAEDVRVRLREACLDLHLTGQLDVSHPVRSERVTVRAGVRRRRRRELLRGPRPQPTAPRQEMLLHLRRGTPWARLLDGEGDDPARGAPAADELRQVTGPREDPFAHGDGGHDGTARARSSSFTTLPVAFTGSASRNSTVRGTLKFAISTRAHSMTSDGSIGGPGSRTTKARPTSPRRASGTPMTATCEMRGWARSRFSISAG